jgi:hypothetical protein
MLNYGILSCFSDFRIPTSNFFHIPYALRLEPYAIFARTPQRTT